jgi:hypothetical protein
MNGMAASSTARKHLPQGCFALCSDEAAHCAKWNGALARISTVNFLSLSGSSGVAGSRRSDYDEDRRYQARVDIYALRRRSHACR